MSADPQRITEDSTLTDALERIRALERRHILGVQGAYAVSTIQETLGDDDVTVWFDLQGGITVADAPLLTNAEEVFDLAVMTTGTAAGKHGLEIKVPGLYRAKWTNLVAAELTDPAQKVQHMEYNLEGAGEFGASSWLFSGNFDASVYGNQSIEQLWLVPKVPEIIGLGASNGRGAGTGDVLAQAYLVISRWDQETHDLSGVGTTLF